MTVPKNTSLTLLSWEALAAHGESTHVDFKAPMSFKDETRGWLAKHIIDLSNVRDGGKLIIGITEDSSKRPIPTGVTDEQAKTFDSTPIATYVNKYVEPPVRLSVGTIEDGGARLIVINVEEFATTPTICTKKRTT